MKKKDKKLLSDVLMVGAAISVVFSAIGYLGTDIWLASTQWLLVASVLALFGVYFKPEE
ncbi:MAG: hypothetical protein CH104c_0733 [Candidatus Woesebacteria bacterium]|jgi:hypothetical protein|nr:MAG: hypothetical protein CH104c_0733 [Candidatus Woesebacteria bacterium]